MTDTARILLVDDHALVRQALSERLAREPDLSVVAVASSAGEAVDAAIRTRPDIVLMDIDMPGMACFDATRTILKQLDSVKVIFLSAFFHDHYIDQALDVKAHGYLTKFEPPECVVAAIREVLNGGAYFSEEVRTRIIVETGGARLHREPRSRTATLSPRELVILRYVAQGKTKKLIAFENEISVKTVDHHITSCMNKLDIHSTVDLVRFAIREGLADV